MVPTLCSSGLAPGDVCALSQHFGDKNVGQAKLLIPSGSINDGNGGKNYSITFVSTNGVIDQTPIMVTATPDNKPYDGTTGSAGVPVVSGAIASGDTPNFSQAFDNRNVGTGKTLIPAGSIDDGTGGSNYLVSFASVNTGTITPRSLSVSATGLDKLYDGTTAATVTLADDRLPGDSLVLSYATAAFSDASVGLNKLSAGRRYQPRGR